MSDILYDESIFNKVVQQVDLSYHTEIQRLQHKQENLNREVHTHAAGRAHARMDRRQQVEALRRSREAELLKLFRERLGPQTVVD